MVWLSDGYKSLMIYLAILINTDVWRMDRQTDGWRDILRQHRSRGKKSPDFWRTVVYDSTCGTRWQSRDQIFIFFKFKTADGRHIENCFGHNWMIIQQPIARFQWNFAWGSSFSQNFDNETDILVPQCSLGFPGVSSSIHLLLLVYTRWCIITRPPSFKRHNLVNIRYIYMTISENIAEEMPSLHI